jgi:hypothetical protein
LATHHEGGWRIQPSLRGFAPEGEVVEVLDLPVLEIEERGVAELVVGDTGRTRNALRVVPGFSIRIDQGVAGVGHLDLEVAARRETELGDRAGVEVQDGGVPVVRKPDQRLG